MRSADPDVDGQTADKDPSRRDGKTPEGPNVLGDATTLPVP